MITRTEAEQRAALKAIRAIDALQLDIGAESDEDLRLIVDELKKIRTWLLRRALGGDKIAIRQTERELGRQVRGPKR